MILAPLVFVAAAWQTPVADYFPSEKGTKWKYTVKADGLTIRKTDEAMGTVEIPDDKPAIRIRSFQNGKAAGEALYRMDEDTLYLIGYKASRLLVPARPVLAVTATSRTWEWKGDEEGLPVTMKASAKPGGLKMYLGSPRDTILVKVEATVGDDILKWDIVQNAVYAKGLGLVEMKEERKTKKTLEKTITTLEEFLPAPGGSG